MPLLLALLPARGPSLRQIGRHRRHQPRAAVSQRADGQRHPAAHPPLGHRRGTHHGVRGAQAAVAFCERPRPRARVQPAHRRARRAHREDPPRRLAARGRQRALRCHGRRRRPRRHAARGVGFVFRVREGARERREEQQRLQQDDTVDQPRAQAKRQLGKPLRARPLAHGQARGADQAATRPHVHARAVRGHLRRDAGRPVQDDVQPRRDALRAQPGARGRGRLVRVFRRARPRPGTRGRGTHGRQARHRRDARERFLLRAKDGRLHLGDAGDRRL